MARRVAGFSLVTRLCGAWSGVVLAFLYLPIAVLVLFSFERTGSTSAFHGATLRWYAELLHEPALVAAAKNSLTVAVASTIASTVLGTAAAWLAHRYRYRVGPVPVGRPVLSLVSVPVVMPDVVMGLSLLVLFAVAFRTGPVDAINGWFTAHGHEAPLKLGLGTLTLAHVTFCFPFVMVAVRARLAALDPSLEEAAQDLGSTPAGAFAKVILPYLLPAVASGALMAFTLSMDDLIVSSFVCGPRPTLPIAVYGMARVGLRPTLNAISALFVAITVLAMVVAERLRRSPTAAANQG
jgi:spermidine/putrescine transport system permease protein